MLSNKPYLLRAFYQWIVDSACNPILVLDATNPKCKVPKDYAEGGEIVFNVSPAAVRDLKMTNELVEFKASFSGVVHIISAPVRAVLAIYAEENGEGLFFDADEEDGISEATPLAPLRKLESVAMEGMQPQNIPTDSAKPKPVLKLVE